MMAVRGDRKKPDGAVFWEVFVEKLLHDLGPRRWIEVNLVLNEEQKHSIWLVALQPVALGGFFRGLLIPSPVISCLIYVSPSG